MGIERGTFLVGPDGHPERTWRKVMAGGHAREVPAAVRELTAG